MMAMSEKFGASKLAIKNLGIEEEFNEDPENAVAALVARMRDPNTGIPIADINWQGTNYSKCFLGCDAVDWMVKTKVCRDREEAVKLANEILVAGKLYHITRRMAFLDGMELFKFESDEDVTKPLSDKIPNVFKTSLEDIMRRQKLVSQAPVPVIMETLIQAVYNLKGTSTEGLFRVPTSLSELEMLRGQFNRGDYSCAAMRDAHLPACLLKLWLRELSDPLIPTFFYNHAICCEDSKEERWRLLYNLPEINQAVILRLFDMFVDLTRYKERTKMDTTNLAMVFSPCFLRCTAEDPIVVMQCLPREGMFVHRLLKDYAEQQVFNSK